MTLETYDIVSMSVNFFEHGHFFDPRKIIFQMIFVHPRAKVKNGDHQCRPLTLKLLLSIEEGGGQSNRDILESIANKILL
jgi:hypothetical protein